MHNPSKVTIVMYHYVREIRNSAYPGIKGLEVEGFRRQLDHLMANYTIITADDLISYSAAARPLPPNACFLTFDDGYKDHLTYVLPELLKRGLQGAFFPPVKPVVEREILDVNSIHFILASCDDFDRLVQRVEQLCLEMGIPRTALDEYWSLYGQPSRYDTKQVMYVKKLLQHALPESIRHHITRSLFEQYVGTTQANFSDELYLSTDDVKRLVECGMYVGSHGYRHLWLDRESMASQESEIDLSLAFLGQVGAPVKDWIMCYPYGGYNGDTLALLQRKACKVGLTTKVAAADLEVHNMLELPRFDTNDFPQ